MYNANFENKPVPGSVIKNCVRVIGTTTEICDEKIYPDPQVVTAAGSIVLSNATTEVNQYYSHDLYEFTIRAYDSNAIIIEEFTTLEYDPSVSSPSLAGAPAFIAANVNVVDGYNFTTTSPSGETFEGTLKITQVYDAVNDAFDTTLQAFGDSYIYTIDDAAILEGTSLKVDTADIFPPPFGTFELTVYDSTGAPIIAFSEPHNNIPQNYPANSGSTYPLLPGVYNPSVNDGGTLYPVAPFCVEPWKICENTAKVNYNGLSASASFVYDLPVDVDQTNIQTQFSTLTVPDQYILRDCTGAVIYDTGQISTGGTPDIQSLDVTAFDFSCGYVELETIPDPMAGPMTVTIFSLSVGCCEGGELCVLPQREPFVSSVLRRIVNGEFCGYNITVANPFVTVSSTLNSKFYYRENISELDGPTCIDPFSSTRTIMSFSRGRGYTDFIFYNGGCLNLGLPSNRVITRVGNKVIVDFVDAASYNMAENFFQTIFTQILLREAASGNNLGEISFTAPSDVLCGDDGGTGYNSRGWFHPDVYISDPVGGVFGAGQICMDFDLPHNYGNANIDICLQTTYDGTQAEENDYLAGLFIDNLTRQSNSMTSSMAAVNNFATWTGRKYTIGNSAVGGDNDVTSDPVWDYHSGFLGIDISSCTHSNPVQEYTLRIDRNNVSRWEIMRGDIASNMISQDIIHSSLIEPDIVRTPYYAADPLAPINGTNQIVRGPNPNDDLPNFNIYIENEDGFTVQYINYPTKSFDLTYYGGGSGELFTDLDDLAARISALTGIQAIPLYSMAILAMQNNPDNWPNIVCKDI